MGQLFDTIRQLVAEEKYVVGQHASERLEERGIMEWQVVAGLEDGELIAERPDATPNPAVVATTEMRLALTATCIGVWARTTRPGTMKTPPPRPDSAPTKPALMARANSPLRIVNTERQRVPQALAWGQNRSSRAESLANQLVQPSC